MQIFTKKYWNLGPLEFFENENFDVHASPQDVRDGAKILDLDSLNHAWPLLLSKVWCSLKNHSTLIVLTAAISSRRSSQLPRKVYTELLVSPFYVNPSRCITLADLLVRTE